MQIRSAQSLSWRPRPYGKLDGGIAWHYATHFARVGRTLNPAPKQLLRKLRDPGGCPCGGAYLCDQRPDRR
jgi:hypothetical protein